MLELMVLPPFGWIVAGVWGALWGSFFNVAIYRVGLYESVTRPRSRCGACGRMICWYDNIPILSWAILGGRCRRCRAPISVRYPLVEALSTLLALAVYWRFMDSGEPLAVAGRFFIYFAFAGTLLVLSGIDLDHMLIPDRITYPAIPIFFSCGLALGDVAPLDLVLGVVIGYGMVAVLAELVYLIFKREGMGYGDAKLLMLVGALLGWRGVVWSFFAAPFVGLLVIVPLKLAQRRKVTGVEVPYGPVLAGAALTYWFFAQRLMALLP